MEIPLSEKNSGTFCIEYRIHPAFRLFFLAMTSVILSASTLFGTVSLPGLIAGIVSLLGALYTEHWIFRADETRVSYYSGLLPFLKKIEWNKEDIASFAVTAFMKGEIDQGKTGTLLEKMDTKITKQSLLPFAPELRIRITLVMELADGSTVVVDDSGIRSRRRLASLAGRISSLTGIPLKNNPAR